MLRVAVTGVGGGCGQGIIHALHQSSLPVRIFAVDITKQSAGLYFPGVIPVVLPKPEENPDAWEAFVYENAIDAILPGSDHDLLPLARHRRLKGIVSSEDFIDIANRKSKTSLFSGVRVPETIFGGIDCDDPDDLLHNMSYPLIVKPDFGMTSRGVNLVKNATELRYWLEHTEKPVVQRYIGGDEYTCGLFFDMYSQYRFGFQMRRTLYAGTTYTAETTDNPVVEAFMEECGRAFEQFNPFGAVNIQIKMEDNTPYLIEINARASGSTPIRAAFGYNEPIMMLRHFVMQENFNRPYTTHGKAYRYWSAQIVENEAI